MDSSHEETKTTVIGLGDISTEPDGLASNDLIGRNALDRIDGSVEVTNRTATHDIAQVLNGFH